MTTYITGKFIPADLWYLITKFLPFNSLQLISKYRTLADCTYKEYYQEEISNLLPAGNIKAAIEKVQCQIKDLGSQGRVYFACKHDYLALFQKSIQRGATISGSLISAVQHNSLQIVKYIVDLDPCSLRFGNYEAVICAACYGCLETVQYLVSCDSYCVLADNFCALRFAAARGYRNVVEYLIAEGADPSFLPDKVRRKWNL